MFIDSVKVFLKAGRGGDGIIAFRREKFVPRGGPAGGHGGDGGSIYFVSDTNVDHLIYLRYKPIIKAKNGAPGEGFNKHGKNGKDIYIKVPVGTIVKDIETGEVLYDFKESDEVYLAAKGGRGGRGNTAFKTSTRRAPRIREEGKPGEEKNLLLELKTIADVGLVGFPNAGKSTLITKVSKAKPEIANYPFTTLTPHPGVVELDMYRSFIMADIPGIIEGAHEGAGLGLRFLKHIERTKLILFMINGDPFSGKKPLEQLEILLKELESYSKKLFSKPKTVALNKIDLINEENKKSEKELKNFCEKKGYMYYKISAIRGDNIKEMLEGLYSELKKHKIKDEEFEE
jgi:GTP-binding protein